MESLKHQIGQSSGPYRDEISKQRIDRFCQAVGIQSLGYAPPTFLTLFRKGEFDLFQKLGIELSRVLHAEQEYQYENVIHAGDHILFETTLTQVLEKQKSTSSMQFITLETCFQVERSSSKLFIGKSKTTIVIREKKGSGH